jgi:hypothetical protein
MKRLISVLASVSMLAVAASGAASTAAVTTRLEAESASFFHATVDSDHAGFSGTGFVNTANEVGSWVEWQVTAAQAGPAAVAVRFANGTTTSRPMDVTVNGALVLDDFPFPSTSTWTGWTTTSMTLNLGAGANSIRLTSSTAGGGPNLDYLEVGSGGGQETLLSQGKPATASSIEAAQFSADKAVDGVGTTRWASAEGADPQWIVVDLGAAKTVTRVELKWEAAYADAYRIETSADGNAWTTAFTTTTGNGGADSIPGLSAAARYVRVYGTHRATSYGYSLWEFEVYGLTDGGGGPPPSVFDLLAGDWAHFSGATVQPGGVQIAPLDRKLVDVNGTSYLPNPPVNLRGPRLQKGGDFRVTAIFDGVTAKGAYLQLYDTVPIIYDEWRQEPGSVRLGLRNGALEVKIWNGHADLPATTKTFGSGLTGRVTVAVRSIGSTFRFLVNGTEVGTATDPGILDHTIWFGADAEVGGGWTLAGLTAQAEPGATLQVLDPPPLAQPVLSDSLRARAARLARPIDIATAISVGPLFADAPYRALAAGQYSMLTPENDMKPQFVQPSRGVFAFAEGDALVDFGQANNMKVHAHTLVWHEAIPA